MMIELVCINVRITWLLSALYRQKQARNVQGSNFIAVIKIIPEGLMDDDDEVGDDDDDSNDDDDNDIKIRIIFIKRAIAHK